MELNLEAIFFKTGEEFRNWLTENQAKISELWVGFYKKSAAETGITYQEAVDQALCFGWIDGVRKTIDANCYKIRFTPRKPSSIWSSVNIKRVAELTDLGLMQPSGAKIFAERRPDKEKLYSFENDAKEFGDEFLERFKANQKAWEFFQAQAAYYRKTATWWVISAKKEEIRWKRLNTLIHDSESGQRIDALTPPSKKKVES